MITTGRLARDQALIERPPQVASKLDDAPNAVPQ